MSGGYLCPSDAKGKHDLKPSTELYLDVSGNETPGRPGQFGSVLPYSSTIKCEACKATLITYNLRWPHRIEWDNRPPKGWTLMTTSDQLTDPVFVVEEDPC